MPVWVTLCRIVAVSERVTALESTCMQCTSQRCWQAITTCRSHECCCSVAVATAVATHAAFVVRNVQLSVRTSDCVSGTAKATCDCQMRTAHSEPVCTFCVWSGRVLLERTILFDADGPCDVQCFDSFAFHA